MDTTNETKMDPQSEQEFQALNVSTGLVVTRVEEESHSEHDLVLGASNTAELRSPGYVAVSNKATSSPRISSTKSTVPLIMQLSASESTPAVETVPFIVGDTVSIIAATTLLNLPAESLVSGVEQETQSEHDIVLAASATVVDSSMLPLSPTRRTVPLTLTTPVVETTVTAAISGAALGSPIVADSSNVPDDALGSPIVVDPLSSMEKPHTPPTSNPANPPAVESSISVAAGATDIAMTSLPFLKIPKTKGKAPPSPQSKKGKIGKKVVDLKLHKPRKKANLPRQKKDVIAADNLLAISEAVSSTTRSRSNDDISKRTRRGRSDSSTSGSPKKKRKTSSIELTSLPKSPRKKPKSTKSGEPSGSTKTKDTKKKPELPPPITEAPPDVSKKAKDTKKKPKTIAIDTKKNKIKKLVDKSPAPSTEASIDNSHDSKSTE
jgi:hypothetical protein